MDQSKPFAQSDTTQTMPVLPRREPLMLIHTPEKELLSSSGDKLNKIMLLLAGMSIVLLLLAGILFMILMTGEPSAHGLERFDIAFKYLK